MQGTIQRKKISITVNGKIFEAEYYVKNGAVTLKYNFEERSTHMGSSAYFIAKMLFRELIQK